MKLFTSCSLAVSVALLAMGCASTAGSKMTARAATQTEQEFKLKKTIKTDVEYLLYLPDGYKASKKAVKGEESKRWPLILFLHGAGERGTNVWLVAKHGPPSLVSNKTDFPFIVVSPQCPEGKIWNKQVLIGLLDDVMKRYNVDPERVYLTGLSMGGYGTWDLGLSYPDRFAAIVPICGGGETITPLLASWGKADALRSLGVWAFHGAKDPVVPLIESQRMVDACRRAGIKEVELTVYPDADHNSWTQTYKNPELYKWLLNHKRTVK